MYDICKQYNIDSCIPLTVSHSVLGHQDDHHEEEFHSFSEEATASSKPWGEVILATVLVNLTSLSGLVFLLIPAIHRGYLKMSGREVPEAAGAKSKALDICVPAFAVGALLATAFFLVFPEAVHLIEGGHSDHGDENSDADSHEGHGHRLLEGEDSHEGHDDHAGSSESQNAAKFGMAVLGGFLLPIFFGILFPHNHHHGMNPADVAEEVAEEVENAEANERDGKASVLSGTDAGCDCCPEDEQGDVETGFAVRQVVVQDLPQDRAAVESKEDFQENSKVLSQKTAIDYRLIASILVGDFFCNFTDGISSVPPSSVAPGL